jgi:hypothetical protein
MIMSTLRDAACLSHAARRWLPPARTGNPTHPSVLSRWSDRGVRAANGERVYLHTWRVGGQRMTTQAAVEEFLAALNDGTPTSQSEDDESLTQRGREASVALEKLGC